MIGLACRFARTALAQFGDALDIFWPMEVADRSAAAFADLLADSEAELEVSEPTTTSTGWTSYPPADPSLVAEFTGLTTYRCADCGWTSLNLPALHKHRQVEHPVGETKALLDESEADSETFDPLDKFYGPYVQRGDRVAVKLADGTIRTELYNPQSSAAKPSSGAESAGSGAGSPLTVPDPAPSLASVAVSTGCSDTAQPAGECPDSSGPTLAGWLRPAIQEVLCQHVLGGGECGEPYKCRNPLAIETTHKVFDVKFDAHKQWVDHLTPILAAHIAKSITALLK